jgi:hypothetical protein
VRLLEQAVQVLDAAAGAGDADLAEACRGVLDSLRSRATAPAARAGADRSTRDPARLSRVPLAPPAWARGSSLEDGGIVHETISPLHPTIKAGDVNSSGLMPTDVSLSVIDLLVDGRWTRTCPTVQVEGGSYTLDGARHLREALDRLLAAADDQDASPTAP